jgi:hypothetical protein
MVAVELTERTTRCGKWRDKIGQEERRKELRDRDNNKSRDST